MVEESTNSLKVPEENDRESSANAVHYRASFSPDNAGNSSMRNSIEKPLSTKIRDNVVPRYLRRSAGSCHDLCKFGRKASSEEEVKARLLIRKKNVKVLPNELIPVQILVPDEKSKEKVVKDKPSTQSRRLSLPLEPSADTKSYSAKHKTSLQKAKVVGNNKPSADAKILSGDLHSRGAKSYLLTTRTSLDAKISSSRQSIVHSTKQKPLSTKKPSSPEPPEIIKTVCFPSEKVEVPAKKGSLAASKIQRSEKKIVELSKQPHSSLKLNLVRVKPPSISAKPDAGAKEQRNNDAGTGKHLAAYQASTEKVLSPKLSLVKIAPIKSRKDGRLASPLKGQNGVRWAKTSASSDEKVSEKTLHVIKTEIDDNVSESSPNDHAISSLPCLPAEALSVAKSSSLASHEVDDERFEHTEVETDKFVSDSHESLEVVSIQPTEENHSKTPRKSRVAVSEVKNGSPVKLKFKTGKIMDLKSENYSLRRLRFMRARVLAAEDDSKASLERTLRKGRTNDNAASADNSSEKVVLKHQKVQDKKDAQGLFNNVIEETASKLVESRKSKVKALVGAFETVISLQESKPSTSALS